MEDLNNYVTGGTLTAAKFVQPMSEMQNVIENTGQALSAGDLNQLGKGIADYIANGDFNTDSGSANTYVLTKIGSKQSPTAYTDGMKISFIAGSPNTGASTVNHNSLGVKDIKLSGGADPAAGYISGRTNLIYDLANDWFEVLQVGETGLSVITSTGSYTKPANLKSAKVTQIGGGGGGGGSSRSGGGGGGCSIKLIAASALAASETVTIGAGGSGSVLSPTGGGTTSFGSHSSATGGAAGGGVLGVIGGIGAGGDIDFSGGSSGPDTPNGSIGGSSFFGGGGNSANRSSQGDDAGDYGAGGGGNAGAGGGGNGSAGVVFIEENF